MCGRMQIFNFAKVRFSKLCVSKNLKGGESNAKHLPTHGSGWLRC